MVRNWHLGTTRKPPDIGLPISPMRINGDLRKCVAFIGFPDPGSKGGIALLGTVFFIAYDHASYLVTAQHIAVGIGDSPFAIRLNKISGGSENVEGDPVLHGLRWHRHSDPNVDLAVMSFNYDLRKAGYDVLWCPASLLVDAAKTPYDGYIGDQCYAIGLFRLMAGETRNLPVVHAGSLALLAGEEPVPVHDWLTPPDSKKIRMIEAYLVEMQSLQGLSGSPVFVRAPLELSDLPIPGGKMSVLIPQRDVKLLGVWQGAWESTPDVAAALQHGKLVRVPVGMGVVTPISKLKEILDMPEVIAERDDFKKKSAASQAAQPDSIPAARPEKAQAEPESDNPSHKEDFTSLLNAAARSNKPVS